MKALILAAALLVAVSGVGAKGAARTDLVTEYIKAARVEQLHNAELDRYIRLKTAGATAAEKKRIEKDIRATMGWAALKGQYATLVRRTYTRQELQSAVRFLKTSTGRKISRKNVDFSQQITSLLEKRGRKLQLQAPAPVAASRAAPVLREKEVATLSSKVLKTSAPAVPVKEAKEAKPQAEPEVLPGSGDLVISNVKNYTQGGQLYFTGKVENKTRSPRRGVQIDVNLFLQKQFVDQYSTFVSGTIAPGAVRYFKVSCNCREVGVPQYDAYKVQVVDSY